MLFAAGVWMYLAAGGAADAPFVQEYHEPFVVRAGDEAANDVRAVAVDAAGGVWAATGAGLFVLRAGADGWQSMLSGDDAGPVFDVAAGPDGAIWAGAWNGVYQASGETLERVPDIEEPISAVCVREDVVAAAGPDGLWFRRDGRWTREDLPCARGVRAVLLEAEGGLWLATGMGLTHHTADGNRLYQLDAEILSADVRALALAPDGGLWAGGLAGVTVYRNGGRAGQFTPKEGLPSVYVQALACGPDGRMWVGTDQGVSRWNGSAWSMRHSRRWLIDDDVRDVAFGPDGTAWVATGGGVSAIRSRTMTLSEKADYFLEVCRKRHVRAPGLVEKCRLKTAGDLATWEPEDDDNDGQYTQMYLVMESLRYAVTKAPDALANAREAFNAMELLQTVTGTAGFIARTVVPPDWEHMHDGNRTLTPQERAAARVEEPRFKPVEERWRMSKDGQWRWKGDTSSDEITGHFFGWGLYYDLAADEAEKRRVSDLTRRVMEYIIGHGFVLVDDDGTHTRWGVWAPERLNHDPDWRAERGINSVEILSYLKTTYHVTGEERYQQEYRRLLDGEGYAENVREAKTYETSWRTHIDDELLIMAYVALLRYEQDPERKALFRGSLDHWYEGVRPEQNPFCNFFYGMLTGQDPQREDSLFTLRDTPLDLVNWRVDNTVREDVERRRTPLIEPMQTSRLMPPSERGVIRWDKNPWEAAQGDGGHTEWAPTFWLLPYWLGRWCGFIAGP
jgi:hypothetical protein